MLNHLVGGNRFAKLTASAQVLASQGKGLRHRTHGVSAVRQGRAVQRYLQKSQYRAGFASVQERRTGSPGHRQLGRALSVEQGLCNQSLPLPARR